MDARRVPLYQRLKRKQHIEIARLQDIVVETLYRVFPDSVLHGGTAIWRCYSGSRFSEDVDVYLDRDVEKIDALFDEFRAAGFAVVKKRVKENSLYSKLVFNGVEVRFEAVFKNIRGIIKEYETYEGVLINVYTLSAEDIIVEKADTYLSRRKIRDLYDIFFMLRHVKDMQKIRPKLRELFLNFREPIDEKELKVLVLFGISPRKDEMLEYIRRWLG